MALRLLLKGKNVFRIATIAALAAVVAGCGSSRAGKGAGPTATAPAPTAATTPAPTSGVSPTAGAAATSVPRPHATATLVLGTVYASFLHAICHSLSRGDAAGVNAHLMHYQYNSGLRWGMFGDGEGTTSDPSAMYTWLSGSHVRCRAESPNTGGHATLLTSGWARPGPWSLLDLDLLNGQWVINDFTFGAARTLARAMHNVAQPVMRYRG